VRPALLALLLLAALALARCAVVDAPVKVKGGHCMAGYLPPGASAIVKDGTLWPHEGGTVYVWADMPVETHTYLTGKRYLGSALAIETGRYETVWVRNPNSAGVVYYACWPAPRAPAGLAAYGAGLTAPPVASGLEAREVRGAITLRRFDAYSVNERYRGFSAQLNAEAVVETDRGLQVYGLQNMILFWKSERGGERYEIADNVWNDTSYPSRLRAGLLKGNGAVRTSRDGEDYYAMIAEVGELRYPFSATLYIRVGLDAEGHPWFAFGYDAGNGVAWYDNVTLLVRARGVKIAVWPPREGAPARWPHSVELVVGGICCGDLAVFYDLDMDIRLEYWNGTAYAPPPFLYSFGALTAEEAEGASVTYLGGGSARLSAGPFRPAMLHSSLLPVRIDDWNGTARACAAEGSALEYEPRDVYLGNGTRLAVSRVLVNGTPAGRRAAVIVRGPTAISVERARQYLVRLVMPNGTASEAWVDAGAAYAVRLPDPWVLPNRTRLAGLLVNGTARREFRVDRPLALLAGYAERQYLIRLVLPNGTLREWWAPEGSRVAVALPDPWDLPNGTRLARLLVNGTELRELRASGPMALVAGYAEVYYRVVVEAPVNRTELWAPRGAVLRFPDVIDLGNGTRLLQPGVRELRVEGPAELRVQYARRQYYVRVRGVIEWEGWADAGAAVRLNATAAGGVLYEPAEALVVRGPGEYRPLFLAVYRTAARDALGVPNPLALARLCNATARAGADGSIEVSAYTRSPCEPRIEAAPVSPYTAAALSAPALALAARALRRRGR